MGLDPITGKPRKPGRPPKHLGANQFTGVRAKNVDYVRRYLQKFLDTEVKPAEDHALQEGNVYTTTRAAYYRAVLQALRFLLAIEGIDVYKTSSVQRAKQRQALADLGEGLKTGTVQMPDLLREIEELTRGDREPDF